MRFSIAALLSLVACVPASAGLLGESIDVTYDFTGFIYSDTVLVGPGTEITCPGGGFAVCNALTVANQTIDVDDASITYLYDGASGPSSFNPVVGFSGFEFAKLDAGGNVLGTIMLTTNMPGLDLSRLTSTSSTIRLNMQGLPIEAGSFFTLSFDPGSDVPEPSTWALLFAGLGAAAARGARRRIRN